jgi:hypothetical protein
MRERETIDGMREMEVLHVGIQNECLEFLKTVRSKVYIAEIENPNMTPEEFIKLYEKEIEDVEGVDGYEVFDLLFRKSLEVAQKKGKAWVYNPFTVKGMLVKKIREVNNGRKRNQ